MADENSEGRSAGTEPASKSLNIDTDSVAAKYDGFPGLTANQQHQLHLWLADTYGIPADRLAFVAIVEIADAKFRRRPYLTLAAAQAAVERAEARGARAKVGLFEIVPLGQAS